MTRIAVLHWHTSSVGGINTTLQLLRDEAISRGDSLHILASDPQKSKPSGIFPQGKRQRVRGGDTFITIDGYAPHHPLNVQRSVEFLAKNFDVVMTSFICPHPTKAYGDDPLFLPLIEGIAKAGLPIVGYIHDAYWETYAEWAKLVLPHCAKTMVAQKAYGEPLEALGFPVSTAYLPFRPWPVDTSKIERDPQLVVWTPQWKNIKGIRKFFDGIPAALAAGYKVELYGNGIEYYKMRKERELWAPVVGKDHFAPMASGDGKAEFFGCVHEHEIPKVYARATFMADFQGSGNPRYAPYRNGSYNHTVIEALWSGCIPIVHTNMLKSSIPNHLLLGIENPEEWPGALDVSKDYDRAGARRYVEENHSCAALYDRILQGVAR